MKKKKSFFLSLLAMKCPKCRRGNMFRTKNPFHWKLSRIFDMYEDCPVCKQHYELETGFWFGTGYVSYALAVVLSMINLTWYWLLIGISWKDDSLLYWLAVNGVILVLVQPWMMRISRAIYLYFFVYYDEDTAHLPDTVHKHGEHSHPHPAGHSH